MKRGLDREHASAYLPPLMQEAQGKCCESQPLSRNRKEVGLLVDLEIG